MQPRDEARRIAANIANLSELLRKPLKAFAPMLTYVRPIVVAVGTLMMLLGVYELAGWWGLMTASGATLLLYGALG